MTMIRMTPVADLRGGEQVDLEGDEYADDGDNDSDWMRYEYAVVAGKPERETESCIRVDFDRVSVGFPVDHRVKVVVAGGDW